MVIVHCDSYAEFFLREFLKKLSTHLKEVSALGSLNLNSSLLALTKIENSYITYFNQIRFY